MHPLFVKADQLSNVAIGSAIESNGTALPLCVSCSSGRSNAIFAPKGTPAPVIAKLNAAAAKALDDENVRKRLLDLGSVIPAAAERTPEALASLVKSEIAKWTPVLKPATN